jgi:hypothetical protein
MSTQHTPGPWVRGLYQCECGAERIGKDNPNANDLRQVTGGAA